MTDYFYEAKAVGDVEFPVTLTFNVDGEEGDQIAVYHHNGNEWEYITLATLTNGQITATFNSLSPIIFVNRSNLTLAPGLYDENDNLLYSWDELLLMGLDVEKDFLSQSDSKSSPFSAQNVLNKLNGTKLVVPNTVQELGDFSFSHSTLKEIILPNSIKRYGELCFDASKIVKIEFPDVVAEYEHGVLWCCHNLVEVKLSNKMTEIPCDFFNYCDKLQSVEIPNSVKKMHRGVFDDCNSIESLTFHSEIENINCDDCTCIAIVYRGQSLKKNYI